MTATKRRFFLFLVFVFILLLNVLSVRHLSKTYDENCHFLFGYNLLKFNPIRFNDSEMPFSALNALPWRIAEQFKYFRYPGAPVNFFQGICGGQAIPVFFWKPSGLFFAMAAGRTVTVFFSLLLAFYVFRWSSELYGKIAGCFSIILYALSPNIIAHSQLITLDLYFALTTTVALYHFWKFMREKSSKNAFWSALTLGISQLSKYTAVFLYPIFLIIAAVRFSKFLFEKGTQGVSKAVLSFVKYGVYFTAVSLLLINAGFLFNRTGTPLKDYSFKSQTFLSAQKDLRFFENVPVPLPYAYLEGLDWAKQRDETGDKCANFYLLGKIHQSKPKPEGFSGYYFWAFLFKEPLAIQFFILFSAIVYFRSVRKEKFQENEIFIFVPVFLFSIYFNYFFKINIGIRHFIMVLPLLYVFCGNLMCGSETQTLKMKSAVIILMSYLAVSVLSYFPYYLPYFNELVMDRRKAYKILADSNLDWGQGGWYVREYLDKHPEAQLDPDLPVSGTVVVDVNKLVGITVEPEKYRWLRENFEPAGHIAHTHLLYQVPEKRHSP